MTVKLPLGLIPIEKPRETVGGLKYYPKKNVSTETYKRHKYYLVLWRDSAAQVNEIGKIYVKHEKKLVFMTTNIRFYKNPLNPKSDMVERYGLYVRMEK
jgi:hypothetical protein